MTVRRDYHLSSHRCNIKKKKVEKAIFYRSNIHLEDKYMTTIFYHKKVVIILGKAANHTMICFPSSQSHAKY